MRIFTTTGTIFTAAVLVFLSACTDITKPPEDIIEGKMKIIWDSGTGLSPELFAINSLKSNFPDAEFSYTKFRRWTDDEWGYNGDLDNYDIAEDNEPGDIIMIESTLAPYLFKTGYLEPLDDYIDKDLSLSERLNADMMSKVREQGDGQTYGIPFGKNVYALYYNTEIFQQLGLPAPSDGMTWDEVLELAWKITDNPLRAGRAALRVPDVNLVFSQFDMRILDPETGLPNIDSPLWEREAQFMDKLNELYERNPLPLTMNMFDHFIDGQLAMIAARFQGDSSNWGFHVTRGLSAPYGKWDMVSFPVFSDTPDTGPAPSYYYLGIPKNSERKQEAFRMISYLLSDEPQQDNSRNGLASVDMNEPETIGSFGERDFQLPGHRVQSFFAHPKEGTLDPEYDWDMQKDGEANYWTHVNVLNDNLYYHRKRLEKLGVMSE